MDKSIIPACLPRLTKELAYGNVITFNFNIASSDPRDELIGHSLVVGVDTPPDKPNALIADEKTRSFLLRLQRPQMARVWGALRALCGEEEQRYESSAERFVAHAIVARLAHRINQSRFLLDSFNIPGRSKIRRDKMKKVSAATRRLASALRECRDYYRLRHADDVMSLLALIDHQVSAALKANDRNDDSSAPSRPTARPNPPRPRPSRAAVIRYREQLFYHVAIEFSSSVEQRQLIAIAHGITLAAFADSPRLAQLITPGAARKHLARLDDPRRLGLRIRF